MLLTKSIFKDRFLFLLVSIVLLITVTPLLKDYIGLRVLMNIFITAVLASGTYAVSEKKGHAVIAGLLAIPMLLSTWSGYFVEIPKLKLVGHCFAILFLAFTAILILSYLFKAGYVTRDVIFGAIVVYLLLGIMWTFVYTVIEDLQPGSFNLPEGSFSNSEFLFFYYSFVTLTTLGYGDITPATGPASSFSLLEAVVGQIYMTVLIAILVGKYLSQSLTKNVR
jgi:voltage-gated potassium channel